MPDRSTWKRNVRQSRHFLVIEDEQTRRTVELEEPAYSIGRHLSNSIVLASKRVSRYHATLLRMSVTHSPNDSYWIIDGDLQGKKSHNGIFVNGQKCLYQELKHGDQIRFGTDVTASYQIISYLSEKQTVYPSSTSSYLYEPDSKIHETLILSAAKLDTFSSPALMRLASFPELSPNPIMEIDLQGTITYLNAAAIVAFTDIQESQLKHPLLADIIAICEHQNENLYVREVSIEEQVFEQYIHYLPESKLIRSYIFDISERKHSEMLLQYQASHDLLTDLPNRQLFNEKLAMALANAKRTQSQVAVMFLDLDRFKNINDTLGHALGDQILKSFAKRLQACLRPTDIVARWGGDEFTILLPEINSLNEVEKLVQTILEQMKPVFPLEKHKFYLSTSIGIAVYPQDGNDGETLLRNADAALYRTKEQGKNNYCFYSPKMNFQTGLSLRLENFLHQALEKDEFLLHYQPQVNVNTGKITGMEALMRWQHPELGAVSPGQFIPLAEETGLIVAIGEWVLRKACTQAQAWIEEGLPPLKVGVNLSPRQFQQPNLVAMIMKVLDETGLDPAYLELEITESMIMQNTDFAHRSLKDLQEMGVHLSMDDFGTGYSSLGYLKKFPFHTLKIDQSFVRDLTDNPKDMAIIAAIMALARGLNMRVIAEGVETQQQLDLLRSMQCEEMQGYWFSKPLNAQEFRQFLYFNYRASQPHKPQPQGAPHQQKIVPAD